MGNKLHRQARIVRKKAKSEAAAKANPPNSLNQELGLDPKQEKQEEEEEDDDEGDDEGDDHEEGGGAGGEGEIESEEVPAELPPPEEKRSTMIIREIQPNSQVGAFLKSVPLVAHLNNTERDKLGGALEVRVFTANQHVFQEGEKGDTFFIIKEGRAVATQKDADGNPTSVAKLSAGDYFGEQSLLADLPRAATVTAETALICYSLDKTKFQALFKKNRLNVKFLQRRRVAVSGEATSEYTPGARLSELEQKHQGPLPVIKMDDSTLKLVLTAIHRSLLFRNLDDTHKLKVASVMHQMAVAKGESIIREGEEGNSLYVVEEGEFDVFQLKAEGDQKEKAQVKVDNHKVGGCFGDLALLYDAPRNATVTAVCDSKVRVLERVWFNRINKELGQARLEQYSRWLANVELLAALTNRERKTIAEALELVTLEPSNVIFTQGDAPDAMYVILSGEVAVTVKKESHTEELRRCRSGESFGERALLVDAEARSTTVTAIVPTQVLRLQRSAFVLLMGPVENLMKHKHMHDQSHSEISTWKPVDVKMDQLKVLGTLGRGSYGFVQLVEDPKGNLYALKGVSKQRIVDTHQKAHIVDEKRVMTYLEHPFLIRLFATYKDKDRLYFLLEPSLGGELFPILRRNRMFPIEIARFYAAQVVLAFQFMHSKHFIYRDLKPENLLLDPTGYIKIADFGFCKQVMHKTWTMCGTPEYLAPEIIASRGHGKGADWWTLGIFIYEMLGGRTPFFVGGEDHMKMYDRILKGKYKFPSHFDNNSRALIFELLQAKPTARLGVVLGEAETIKTHPFFTGLDWQALLWKKIPAPLEVTQRDPRDPSQFKTNLQEKEVKAYVDDGTGWDAAF